MKIGPRDAWIIARLLGGRVPVAPGGIEPILESERVRPLADRLRETATDQRASIWKGFLTGRPDRDDWSGPVGEADPAAPPPPEDAPTAAGISPRANLDDLKRLVADTSWPWPGWLAGGVLNTLAADPGVGKTILAMNLARIPGRAVPGPTARPTRSRPGPGRCGSPATATIPS